MSVTPDDARAAGTGPLGGPRPRAIAPAAHVTHTRITSVSENSSGSRRSEAVAAYSPA